MRVFGLSVVAAIAAGLVQAHPAALHKRAIDTATWETLLRRGQYAQASYCENNDAPLAGANASRPIECPADASCGQAVGSEIIYAFDGGTSVFAPTGFVAIDRTLKEIIVAFRGTDPTNINNIITDVALAAQQAAPELCSSCRVSVGALKSIRIVQQNITTAVLGALAQPENEGFEVSFVGHSLGGALTTLSAALFRVANPSIAGVALYSFASPRLLNPAAAQLVTDQGNNFRLTHNKDIVPRAVPRSLIGAKFEHFAPEFFITSPDLPQPPGVIDFLPPTVGDLETQGGNSGPAGDFVLGTNILNEHMRYLLPIGWCGDLGAVKGK